jgi:hypothetical protein
LIRQTKKSLSFFWIVLSFPIAFPLEKWSWLNGPHRKISAVSMRNGTLRRKCFS